MLPRVHNIYIMYSWCYLNNFYFSTGTCKHVENNGDGSNQRRLGQWWQFKQETKDGRHSKEVCMLVPRNLGLSIAILWILACLQLYKQLNYRIYLIKRCTSNSLPLQIATNTMAIISPSLFWGHLLCAFGDHIFHLLSPSLVHIKLMQSKSVYMLFFE